MPTDRKRLLSLLAAVLAAATVVVGLLLYGVGIDAAVGNSDEALYAEFVRAMHESGDYGRLVYGGAEVLQRPVLPVTLYALVARVVPGELGLRLLPVLLTFAAALAVGVFVLRRAGAGAAALAFALAAFAPTVHVYGRLAMSDPPFVLAATLALLATLLALRDPGGLHLALWALGAAFATKSLAAAVPAAALAPWLIVAYRRHRGQPHLRARLGLAGFVLLAAPFYVAGFVTHGGRFAREHLGYNLWSRAAGGLPGVGIGGPLAYVRHVFLADGALLGAVLLGGLVLAAAVAWRRRDEELGAAATSALLLLLFLSLLGTRLPHYLLVFYPAAALTLGLLVGRLGGIASAPVAVLALALVGWTSGRPTFDESTVPAVAARALGRAAGAGKGPIYSLDWYAPALGHYARRPWRLLSTEEAPARRIGAVDIFRQAGTVSLVPPWPAGRFLVAGGRARLERAAALEPPLRRRQLVAESDGRELWEAGE